MVSHVSLIVAVITVKNNSHACIVSLSIKSSQMIKFKYFFSANQSPQLFTTGDVVFLSGKYIVENSKPCFTIAYLSIIENENQNCEFNATTLPVCVPHCIYLVIVNREAKKVNDFINFGAETIKYNSVTTTLYLFYIGLFKFSKSGNIMIEATNIDYLRTSTISITASEITSSITNKPLIIDIIDDDIESIIMQPKQLAKSSLPPSKNINVNTLNTHYIDWLPNGDVQDQKVVELDDDIDLQDETDDLQEIQPRKRRKSTGT
ncbi:22063_t:CDS:2 [Dentiscutata erythropus]|uniref:22063_t:CDS:1 n=1 Tax=Dentiscutata erythropus TaxID=1348616 RepID=A0A9N9F6P9_9GLOM|nr:22063_t:CDS:2 [Dentiscutata erythropus]